MFPAYKYTLINKYIKVTNEIEKMTGHKPTDSEYMYLLNISAETLEDVRLEMFTFNMRSLDEKIELAEGDPVSLADMVADDVDQVERFLDSDVKKQLARDIWACVSALPDQQARFIELHYKYNMKMNDIAQKENVSSPTVTRQIKRGLKSLKKGENARRLKPYSELYLTSKAYCGKLADFNRTHTSIVEKIVIKDLEA